MLTIFWRFGKLGVSTLPKKGLPWGRTVLPRDLPIWGPSLLHTPSDSLLTLWNAHGVCLLHKPEACSLLLPCLVRAGLTQLKHLLGCLSTASRSSASGAREVLSPTFSPIFPASRKWVDTCSSRGSSQLMDWTCVSCIAGRFFPTEPPGKLLFLTPGLTQLLPKLQGCPNHPGHSCPHHSQARYLILFFHNS